MELMRCFARRCSAESPLDTQHSASRPRKCRHSPFSEVLVTECFKGGCPKECGNSDHATKKLERKVAV